MHHVDFSGHGAEGVKLCRVFDAGNDIRIGTRADFPAFVEITDQLAVAARAEPNVMPGLGAIGGDGKSLCSSGHEFDRPVEALGRKRNHRGSRCHVALRAERAADEV